MRTDSVLEIPVEQIVPDPNQPRQTFNEKSLAELAETIKAQGLIQPVEVTSLENGRYMLVHGERRYRAHVLAELPIIRAIVTSIDYSPLDRAVRQYIENDQREEMNVIDEAEYYARLLKLPAPDGSKMSKMKLARLLGIKHTTLITNRMVWLDLEPEIQELARQEKLKKDVRIPKALLKIPDSTIRVKLAHQFANRKVSINAIEAACGKAAKKLAETAVPKPDMNNGLPPMLNLAASDSQLPDVDKQYQWLNVRQMSKQMCETCSLSDLVSVAEPAWHLVMISVEQTCKACSVNDLKICQECPSVDLLKRMIKAGRG